MIRRGTTSTATGFVLLAAATIGAIQGQEVTSSHANDLLIYAGVDVTSVPSTSDLADLPDLYRPPDEATPRFETRSNVFMMLLPTIEESQTVWLKYPAGTGRFYLEVRDDRRRPGLQLVYGPLVGDPFERLDLERKLTEALASANSIDAFYRLKLMIRTGDSVLIGRAAQLLAVSLEEKIEGFSLEQNVRQVQEIVDEYAPPIRAAGLESALTLISDKLTAAKTKINELTVEFPESDYRSASDVGKTRSVPTEISMDQWGEIVNGLRLAVVPERSELAAEEAVVIHLVLENTSKSSIRIAVSDVFQRASATVKTTDGAEVPVTKIRFSGISPIERYLIGPGERLVLSQPLIEFHVAGGAEALGPGTTRAAAGAGTYQIEYEVIFQGGAWHRIDGVEKRVMPAKGEWTGVLRSGAVTLRVDEA